MGSGSIGKARQAHSQMCWQVTVAKPPKLLYLQISLNECLCQQAESAPSGSRAILAASLSGTPFVAFFTRCPRAPPPGIPTLPREAATCRHGDPPANHRPCYSPAALVTAPQRRARRVKGQSEAAAGQC
ncbi:hypothetical protein ACOMHN_048603 [Nucella lapillus]